MVKTPLARPVAGMYREDIVQLDLALAGMSYPAQKWQLLAYAEREPAGHGRPGLRTIHQLWALPAGSYADLAHVLVGAARTARGHPHRGGA